MKASMRHLPQSMKHMAKYSLAAISSAVADWVVFICLNELTAQALFSQGVARLTGGGVSFVFNKNVSFRSFESRASGELVKFTLLYAVSYVLSILFMYAGVYFYSDYEYVVKILSDSVLFLFNFFMMKFFVFRNSC